MLRSTPTVDTVPVLEASNLGAFAAPPRSFGFYETHWGALGAELMAADKLAMGCGWTYAGEAGAHEINGVLATLPHALEVNDSTYATRPRARMLQDYLLSGLTPSDIHYAPDEEKGGLSVRGSLLCLDDHRRTLGFVAAVREAVSRLEAQLEPNREIFVVDAGCGAAPLLGLYAALCSSRVRVLAYEVNPASARLAQAIVKKFGLEGRMEIRLRDATSAKLTRPIDLLVSDTLHTGLSKEPLVRVFENLAPYLAQHGICIPHAVTVRGGLVREQHFHSPPAYVHIAEQALRAFEVEWQSSFSYRAGDSVKHIALHVDGSDRGPGPYVAVVGSRVDLGFGFVLDGYDSLITHPYPVLRSRAFYDRNSLALVSSPHEHGTRRVRIAYAPGEVPVLAD